MARFFSVALLGLLLGAHMSAQAPVPSRDAQTKELLDLMVDSLGGPQKLNSIHSFRRKSEVRVSDTTVNEDEFITAEASRSESPRTATGGIVAGITTPSSRVGFIPGEDPSNDVHLAGQAAWLTVCREPILALQHVDDPAYSFDASGEEAVGGIATTVLEVAHGDYRVTFWVDSNTGRVVRRRQIGNGIQFTEDFSDWRSVEGVVVPFRVEFDSSRGHGTRALLGIAFNPPINSSVFDRNGPTLASFPMNAATPLPAPLATKPHHSDVTVTTNPGGASVYVDDEPKGVTSPEGRLVLKGLPLGTHQIRVALVGHKQQVISREFKGGSEEVAVRLEKEGPRPLALEEVENALAGLPRKKVLELVKEYGVDFDITPERETRLRAAGADDSVLYAITQNKK
jgi:hypothetical protein